MGLYGIGMCLGLGAAWLIATSIGEDAAFANLAAVLALLLGTWALTASGLMLASGTDPRCVEASRLRTVAVWSGVSLLVATIALTIYAAWYVIVAVAIAWLVWKVIAS